MLACLKIFLTVSMFTLFGRSHVDPSSKIETTSESRHCRSRNPGLGNDDDARYTLHDGGLPTDHLLLFFIFSDDKDKGEKGARVYALLPPKSLPSFTICSFQKWLEQFKSLQRTRRWRQIGASRGRPRSW